MKLKFLKGTKLYKAEYWASDSPSLYLYSGKKLTEKFEADKPENDNYFGVGGEIKRGVSKETTIHYKDGLYVKCGDAINWENKDKIIITIATIAICIISFIIYKRKHK